MRYGDRWQTAGAGLLSSQQPQGWFGLAGGSMTVGGVDTDDDYDDKQWKSRKLVGDRYVAGRSVRRRGRHRRKSAALTRPPVVDPATRRALQRAPRPSSGDEPRCRIEKLRIWCGHRTDKGPWSRARLGASGPGVQPAAPGPRGKPLGLWCVAGRRGCLLDGGFDGFEGVVQVVVDVLVGGVGGVEADGES